VKRDAMVAQGQKLPDFDNAGLYRGDIPASRWLARLAFDFQEGGHIHPEPERFLDAIEILLEDEPATRLESTPWIRKIIDKRRNASAADVQTVKNWLMGEFPILVENGPDEDIQSDIEAFAQGGSESLSSYYQRAVTLLRRCSGRDNPRDDDTTTPRLEGCEITVVNWIILAFVRGLYHDELRKASIHKDAATCGALWKSYEIIQRTQRSLTLLRKDEEFLANKTQFEELETFILNYTGQPATVVLGEFRKNREARQNLESSRSTSPRIHAQQQPSNSQLDGTNCMKRDKPVRSKPNARAPRSSCKG
jgi:hypothetical protein